MRVLEVNCGAGAMTPWLSRQGGLSGRVAALDKNPREVERARLKAMESVLDTSTSSQNQSRTF